MEVMLLEETPITVHVNLDAKTFRTFALFDTLIRQKRRRVLVLFAAIMLGFAAVCFAMRGRAEQALLLGGVLAGVGVVLPLGYLLHFYLSVRDQIKKFGLKEPKPVYSLTFSGDQVTVTNGKDKTSFAWGSLYRAYRRKDCIYLYAAVNKAFLLPAAQIDGGDDALWSMLERHMAPASLFSGR